MARSLSRGPTGRDELIESNLSQTNRKTSSSGEKKDDKNLIYGNKKGQIIFGHLHASNPESLESDVQSGVMLRALDPIHYMSMDNDGIRKGWTLNRSPGPYEIICATHDAGVPQSKNDVMDEGIGFLLIAERGDIVIRAPRGRIRLSAIDIDITAEGPDNKTGNINIDSNNTISFKTPIFEVNADTRIRMYTPNSMSIVANTGLTFVSNFMNGLSAASNFKPDKSNLLTTANYISNSLYV